MASKKSKLFLLGVCVLLAMGSFAQKQKSAYDPMTDSAFVSNKGMAQQNEFWNHTYAFPAKPRSMWEIGVSGGVMPINGRVPAQTFKSIAGGLHIRKALGYVLSLRLDGTYGVSKGLDWGPSEGWGNNTAWADYKTDPLLRHTYVVYNYKSTMQNYELQALFNLNNILFHKANSNLSLYMGVGGGITLYHTEVNTHDANGNPYNFDQFFLDHPDYSYANRKSERDALKTFMNGSYNTPAMTRGTTRQKNKKNTMDPSASLIAGIQYKLSKRINIALEDKLTMTHDDYLDGQAFQEHSGTADPALAGPHETFNYASIGLNFNIGNKNKAVEPLYWINPLTYVYNELNVMRHPIIPEPKLKDTDGDGVIDQMDKEPNTPAGCPVDSHGVTKDTDGDGVPDCKDKELITPTNCQPVDADGVGHCPEPACCQALRDSMKNMHPAPTCNIGSLPSMTFKGGARGLSKDQKTMLATVASKMKANADCKLTITGHPKTSKASQSLCNDRVNAISKYLTEKEGISADRITTDCTPSETGNETVDLSGK